MRQGDVNTPPGQAQRALTGGVIENIVGGIIAIGLIAYLVYALARPDRF